MLKSALMTSVVEVSYVVRFAFMAHASCFGASALDITSMRISLYDLAALIQFYS